jgi:hypothetical protein
MPSESERRRIMRIRFDAPIGARVATAPVHLRDISADGAKIEHEFPLTRGKKVQLEFTSEGSRVTVPCEVIRCKLEKRGEGVVYCTGLRFSDPEDGSMTILRKMLANFVRRDFDARKEHMLKIKK